MSHQNTDKTASAMSFKPDKTLLTLESFIDLFHNGGQIICFNANKPFLPHYDDQNSKEFLFQN